MLLLYSEWTLQVAPCEKQANSGEMGAHQAWGPYCGVLFLAMKKQTLARRSTRQSRIGWASALWAWHVLHGQGAAVTVRQLREGLNESIAGLLSQQAVMQWPLHRLWETIGNAVSSPQGERANVLGRTNIWGKGTVTALLESWLSYFNVISSCDFRLDLSGPRLDLSGPFPKFSSRTFSFEKEIIFFTVDFLVNEVVFLIVSYSTFLMRDSE